jgi:hypothetical protein
MKRLVLALAIAVLVPGTLGAATLGCYFGYTPGQMAISPTPFSFFDIFVIMHNADYYVTAVEYQLMTPYDPTHVLMGLSAVTYPSNVVATLGDPFTGHSIAFWPPLNGYMPGYSLVCTIKAFTLAPCGQFVDYPLVVGPHPESGELRGTFVPDNEFFMITGLTSIICPEQISVKEESWGAIKSLYR